MSDPAWVELENVSMTYGTPAGSVHALRNVSFSIAGGESAAILGPSGCGKSTLLALIGALEVPTSGRVSVAGRVVSDLPDRERSTLRRREFGFVFQADNLHPFLTVLENVALQLSLAGAEGADGRCREVLAKLGLNDQMEKLPDQLSGGQRQRVGIARALVHRPQLILADEPTGALDPATSATVVDALLASCLESGATLIVVTHDRGVGGAMDRTIAMRDGALAQESAANAG